MGSVGNQNPWAPYNDCSQTICSINCPQFCYFFFPPPPSPEDDSAGPLSPLIIAVIGVLAGAFLLVGYYTIVNRYCNRRPFDVGDHDQDSNINHHQGLIRCRVGLDESLIRAIAVREYREGDGLIEGTECAVCLTDFRDKEPLRILPKCSHAFHLPCIDTWLRSQSSCPLCRAGVIALARPALQDQSAVALNVDTGESHRDNADLILVIDDDGDDSNNNNHNTGEIEIKCEGEGVVRRFGRSVSLGAFPFRRQLLISDVVEIVEGEKDRCGRGIIGSSRTHVALKRSVSASEL